MSNIRRIEGKTGVSYQITVASGRDASGRQIRHYKTWTPDAKMTARQMEKEVQRVAYEFEQQIEKGFCVDNRQTFAEYARYVIALKESAGAKHRTAVRYRELMERIEPAIGNIKLVELRPQHLNAFYKNLAESGVRKGRGKAVSKADLPALFRSMGYTRAQVAQLAGIAPMTVTTAARGQSVSYPSAQAIAGALRRDASELFQIETDSRPLSNKTIVEHHRLISTVLAQAEKEMLVLYNAASKATPPKLEHKEAATFQPEEIVQIRDCLEREPLKWKTATHLLLITGARRGEVMGLKWDRVD